MINANLNSVIGYRHRSGEPAVLIDGNTVAWFDGAEQYMTKDSSNRVAAWADRSGNANHLLQAGADAIKPVWSADGVLFDGAGDYMKCTAFTLAQPIYVYMVAKNITFTANDTMFDGNTLNSAEVYQVSGSVTAQIYAGDEYPNFTIGPLDTYYILRAFFNGASSTVQVNTGAVTSGDFGDNAMGGFTLAAKGNTASQCNMQVKEVILRNVADGAADEATIYSYLADKYSIS